jgi:hypothetical protein
VERVAAVSYGGEEPGNILDACDGSISGSGRWRMARGLFLGRAPCFGNRSSSSFNPTTRRKYRHDATKGQLQCFAEMPLLRLFFMKYISFPNFLLSSSDSLNRV